MSCYNLKLSSSFPQAVCSEREQSKLGDTEGHYTVHNGDATDGMYSR